MAETDIKPGQLTGDKSARSVFVGNIPYEATEEKLKEIFSEVGTVLSFKLVYDRENGKPKGYGFCEYMNPEIALCAMRNLNGYEFGSRTLRVDSACTEKSQMMQALTIGNIVPLNNNIEMNSSMICSAPPAVVPSDPYGERVDPDKAPEAISKAVASLPPEQMFELMKQMKMCIQNNPQEARNMLLQNPQLAYALLQAQVVMRIVDPEMALQMLHKSSSKPLSIGSRGESMQRTGAMGGSGPMPVPAPSNTSQSNMLGQMVPGPFSGSQAGMRPEGSFGQGFGMSGDVGFERDDPRNPALHGMPQNRDPRGLPMDDSQRFGGRDPRSRDPRAGGDPRVDRSNFDPRNSNNSQINNRGQMPMPNASVGAPNIGSGGANPIQLPPHLANADPSRTQLIMQVLQLTDEQIAMLPTEQRLSIMELKKQIANNK